MATRMHAHVVDRQLEPWRWASIGLLVVLGLGALAGGLSLVAQPDGGVMGFDRSILLGSPFSDFLLPGVVLGGLFGVGSFAVAWLAWRRHPVAPFLAFAIGFGQMLWIAVELAIIHELSWLHPAMFTVGMLIAGTAVRWGWPTFEAWRQR
jgi:hypothetical protein